MSLWDQLNMDSKTTDILRRAKPHSPRHHFNPPYLTPYQIAMAFRDLFPLEFKRINKPVGGKGTGQQTSLAQYIAQGLSSRIKRKKLRSIEGGFLYRKNLDSLTYKDATKLIKSSTMTSYDLSIFRLKDLHLMHKRE